VIQRYRFRTMQALLDRLVELLEEPVPDRPLLEPEHIIVPSQDLGKWLTIELARRSPQQIAANLEWYQPAGFIDQWSEQLLDGADQNKWNKANLQWAIYLHIGKWSHEPEMRGLPSISDADPNAAVKRFRLAGELADVYDQYMIYRPKWLMNWRQSPERDRGPKILWQSLIWHRLNKLYPDFSDRAMLNIQAREALNNNQGDTMLPQRALLIAPSLLPKASMQWLGAWQGLPDHTLLVLELAPFQRDEISPPQPNTSTTDQPTLFDEPVDPPKSKEDPVWQQWAHQYREYTELTNEVWPQAHSKTIEPNGSASNSTLGEIQSILKAERPAEELEPTDRSIRIHATHGPRREVEVMYDELLRCFDEIENLQPDEVLVVTPDLDTYAPYFKAMFESPGDDDLQIDAQIADPSQQQHYQLTDLLLQWLDTANGRFKVTSVMELLEHPVIRQSTKLTTNDLEQVEQWLLDTRVRWGYDGAHRKEILEETDPASLQEISGQNSWQYALNRIWMGWSYRSSDEDEFVHQWLPYSNVEGQSDQRRLGMVQRLIRHLWQWHQLSSEKRSWTEWKTKLWDVIQEWFTTEDADDMSGAWLMEQVAQLDELQELDGDQRVPLGVIQAYLNTHVLKQRMQVARRSGRVLVGGMVALRNIPARVVALVGFNEGDIPGSDPVNPFDAMDENPVLGDRSRRKEDRQLFIDYLLQAQDRCIITYTGRDQRNDDEIHPSILVSELLDLITHNQQRKHEKWITQHALHAFDPPEQADDSITYFPSRLRQQQATRHHQSAQPWVSLVGLDHPVDWTYWKQQMEAGTLYLSLDDVIRFYRQPLRAYVEQVLGVTLYEDELVDEDVEPFQLDHLTKYSFMNTWLHQRLLDPDLEPPMLQYQQMGILPHGLLGQQTWQEISKKVDKQRTAITDALHTDALKEPQEFEIDLTKDGMPIHLTGTTSQWLDQTQVVLKTGGSLKAKDQLHTWIRHLFANAAGVSLDTQCWAEGKYNLYKVWTAPSLDQEKAKTSLQTLIDGYLIGQRQPLALLLKSGLAWTEALLDEDQDEDDGLKSAQKAYYDEFEHNARHNEHHDPYNQFLFRSVNPYDMTDYREPLTQNAEQIWKPLLKHTGA
jgi:exodeoxyribonuclease V gamma subunit